MHAHISVRSGLTREGSEFSCIVRPLSGLLVGEADEFDEKIRLFIAGANAGMYSGERFRSWLSECELIERQGVIAKEHEALEIRFRQIDWGAVRILINLLSHTLGERGWQIEIGVWGEQGKDSVLSPLMVEQVPYPGVFSPSFDLDMSYPTRSLEPVSLRIECVNPLTELEVDMIRSMLRLWGEIVREGGYCQTVAEHDELPDLSEIEIYLLSPAQVEMTAYGFYGSDAAFNGLVNVLSRINTALTQSISSAQIW